MINRKAVNKLPSGGHFADFKTHEVVDMGGKSRRCVKWTWIDDYSRSIRFAFFDLENGDYISDE